MKRFSCVCYFILSGLLLLNIAYGQVKEDPSVLMQKGKEDYDHKQYLTSAKQYAKVVNLINDRDIGSSRYMAAYNSACSWALAGQPDSAFTVLNKIASEESFGMFYPQMLKDSDFNSLHNDKRWDHICAVVKRNDELISEKRRKFSANLNDTSKRINHTLLQDSSYWKKQAARLSVNELINKIKLFNSFPAAPEKNWWTLYRLNVNDTLQVSYLVHIPKNYDAHKKTPLYVFLHGGVGRQSFSDPINDIELEAPVLKRAFIENAFVILPFANKNFNWLYHQQAFESILKEIAQVKAFYDIDDNKVYIGGHSDGARGAFWFAVNQRTPFAAFFGLNYFPILLTGNTPLRNLRNEAPFEGISGRDDKGFNIKQVTQMVNYARLLGANWQNTPVQGEHGLPYDKPDSVFFLFDRVIRQIRNPIPQKIQWETDDTRNGQCYWLTITQLDTLQQAQTWQEAYNPTVTSLKTGKDEVRNLNKKKSRAVLAEIRGNHIYIKTSRVKQLEINIPKQWANQYKTMNIHINDKPAYTVSIRPNKTTIIGEFFKTKDRTLIVVDKISITAN